MEEILESVASQTANNVDDVSEHVCIANNVVNSRRAPDPSAFRTSDNTALTSSSQLSTTSESYKLSSAVTTVGAPELFRCEESPDSTGECVSERLYQAAVLVTDAGESRAEAPVQFASPRSSNAPDCSTCTLEIGGSSSQNCNVERPSPGTGPSTGMTKTTNNEAPKSSKCVTRVAAGHDVDSSGRDRCSRSENQCKGRVLSKNVSTSDTLSGGDCGKVEGAALDGQATPRKLSRSAKRRERRRKLKLHRKAAGNNHNNNLNSNSSSSSCKEIVGQIVENISHSAASETHINVENLSKNVRIANNIGDGSFRRAPHRSEFGILEKTKITSISQVSISSGLGNVSSTETTAGTPEIIGLEESADVIGKSVSERPNQAAGPTNGTVESRANEYAGCVTTRSSHAPGFCTGLLEIGGDSSRKCVIERTSPDTSPSAGKAEATQKRSPTFAERAPRTAADRNDDNPGTEWSRRAGRLSKGRSFTKKLSTTGILSSGGGSVEDTAGNGQAESRKLSRSAKRRDRRRKLKMYRKVEGNNHNDISNNNTSNNINKSSSSNNDRNGIKA